MTILMLIEFSRQRSPMFFVKFVSVSLLSSGSIIRTVRSDKQHKMVTYYWFLGDICHWIFIAFICVQICAIFLCGGFKFLHYTSYA